MSDQQTESDYDELCDLRSEVQALRRKVAAAKELAEAIKNYDDLQKDPDFRAALAAWQEANK